MMVALVYTVYFVCTLFIIMDRVCTPHPQVTQTSKTKIKKQVINKKNYIDTLYINYMYYTVRCQHTFYVYRNCYRGLGDGF